MTTAMPTSATPATLVTLPPDWTAPLTAADRCDRCGAQALVRTHHATGPLLWCGHHYIDFKPALQPLHVHGVPAESHAESGQ